MPDVSLSCDVAIVGAGPSGLAAATQLKALGVSSVTLIERETEAGGIPRHCGHYPFGMREFRSVLKGPDYARRLVDQAVSAGVTVRTATSVVRLGAGPCLDLSTPDGSAGLAARKVLLCTGVRETSRAARFIGGDRAGGILSTGALQSMVYLSGRRPFERPVIVGTELVSFSALLTCRHAGIRPVAMIEQQDRPTAWQAARGLPMLMGIPLWLGTRLVAIHGRDRVEAVTTQKADGSTSRHACDGVILSGRFTPEASLMRMAHLAVDPGSGGPSVDQYGRCSDPDFFAAGNLLRPVETAGWSWREGCTVAEVVASDLDGRLEPSAEPVAVRAAGDAIRFAVPQTLARPLEAGRTDVLQLRVSRPIRGRLTITDGERLLWSKRINTLPERRLLVPLKAFAHRICGDAIVVRIEEAS
ncbi:MAG: FAD-dependent oxidoreductase [Pseudomonadota bacterium]